MRILPFFLILFSFFAQAQNDLLEENYEFRKKLNEAFRNPEESPLTKEKLPVFSGLSFFPFSEKFYVVADLQRTPNEPSFEMLTTTARKPVYKKYGIVTFTLGGRAFKLPIYQNLGTLKSNDYQDYLFLPFTDLTNGAETYGGGRYIDLRIPEGDSIVIDFNKAYNPYCAYNHNYSCPVVPLENHIDFEVKAGVTVAEERSPRIDNIGFSVDFPGDPTYSVQTINLEDVTTIQQFQYEGEFATDSNYVFRVQVIHFSSDCPFTKQENKCFQSFLIQELEQTHSALMHLKRIPQNGQDAYEFELMAQGRSFSKYRVLFKENTAFVAFVLTFVEVKKNQQLRKFLDSFVLADSQ